MSSEYVNEGVPFLRSQNILPFRLRLDDVKFIRPEFHARLRKSALRPGDVVVVRTGYPGVAAVVPATLPDANCADLVVISAAAAQLDPYYLAAVFNSTWGQASVAGNLVGVAQQHFNIGAARNLEIALPSVLVQRRIAGVLSAYDDFIDNNLRRIRILEEMARSLFREWFVGFRVPGLALPVEPPELPQGWSRVPLRDCVEVNPKVVVPREGEKPFVSMGALSNDSMVISDIERRTGNSGAKFQNGDTLFARITPCLENGKTGFVQFLPDARSVAFGSTEFIVLRSMTLTPEFVYLLSRTDEFRGTAIKSMSGASGRQRVQERCFDSVSVVQPPVDVLPRFTEVVGPMFRLIHQLHLQNLNLCTTRDLLLPRLLSDQSRLLTAEDSLAAVEDPRAARVTA